MTEPHPDHRTGTDPHTGDIGSRSDREPAAGTPRWVKVLGILVLVLALLALIMTVVRGPGGGHGPGRHTSSVDGNASLP